MGPAELGHHGATLPVDSGRLTLAMARSKLDEHKLRDAVLETIDPGEDIKDYQKPEEEISGGRFVAGEQGGPPWRARGRSRRPGPLLAGLKELRFTACYISPSRPQ